eukprot:m.30915 g.30915  ORF g.30915 m.30915 type:complete len:430 (+) comp12265_c0_seq2:278-1567(+)
MDAAAVTSFSALCDAELAAHGPEAALGFMFKEMCRTEYIVEERLAYNINFPPQTVPWRRQGDADARGSSGDLSRSSERTEADVHECVLEVSINCSKPEIAVGVVRKPTPLAPDASCVICPENVGHKPGLMAWKVTVGGRPFFLQCPPYPYCHLHTVLVETAHTPQKISRQTLLDLTDVAGQLPGIYMCSNTDLSGTGASILQHKHYQLVGKRLPVCDAQAAFTLTLDTAEAPVEAAMLDFPTAAVRVTGTSECAVVDATTALLDAWRSGEMADTIGAPLASLTMSFIASFHPPSEPTKAPSSGIYCMIVIPRTQQNVTSPSMHCIKSEFVGILEAAGFGILPGRLKTELSQLLLERLPLDGDLAKYTDWMRELNVVPHSPGEVTELKSSQIVADALYTSLVKILKDNSGFDSCDHGIARRWLSLAGFQE